MRGAFIITTSLALCISLTAAEADPDPRGRQAARPRAFEFAANVNEVVGEIYREFSCDGLTYGYYADQFQDCKVFHICMPVESDTGKILDTFQFSFFCPNQTRFSQDTRTCISEVYAYPCHDAHKLYDLNKAIGHKQKNRRKPLKTSFRKSVDIVANAKNAGNIADLFRSQRRKENTKLRIDKPHTPFIPQLTSPFTVNPTTSAPITGPSFVSTSRQHNNKNGGSGSSRQIETNSGQAKHTNGESGSLTFNNVVINNNQVEPIVPGGAQLFSQTSTNVKKSQSHTSKVTSIKKVPSVTSSIRGSSSLSTQNTKNSGNSKTVVNNVSAGINTFGTSSGSNTFEQASFKSNVESSRNKDTSSATSAASRGSSNSGLNTARGSSLAATRGSVRGSSSLDTSKVSKNSNINTSRGSSNINGAGANLSNTDFSSTTLSNSQHFKNSGIGLSSSTIGTTKSSNSVIFGSNTASGSSVAGTQSSVRGSSNIKTSRGSSSLNRGGGTFSNTGFSSTTSLNSNSENNKNSGLGLSSSSFGRTATQNSEQFGTNTVRGSSNAGNQAAVRGSSNLHTSRGSSNVNGGSTTLSNTGFASISSTNSNNFRNSGIKLSSTSFGTTGSSNSVVFGSNGEQATESSFNSGNVKSNSPLPSSITIPGAKLVSISKRPLSTNAPFTTITDASAIVGKPATPTIGRGITTVLGRKSSDTTQNKFSSQSRGSSSTTQNKSSSSLRENKSHNIQTSSHHGSSSTFGLSSSSDSQSSNGFGSSNINTNSFGNGKIVNNNIGIHKNAGVKDINIPGFSSGVHRVNGHLESDSLSSSGHTSTFRTTLPLPITTRAPFVSRPIHPTNVPQTSSFVTTNEKSNTQTTSNLHSHSSSINTSNNVKQGTFSNNKKTTGVPFPGRSSSTQTSSVNTNTGRLRGSGATISTGNQHSNSHGQVSSNFNDIISAGIKSTVASLVKENQSSSNILSGSHTSKQNQEILNSGRRGATISQINASGAQSQRGGSNLSQVSGSTTTNSRTTSSTTNQNANSHGQVSSNFNDVISAGIKSTVASLVNENQSSPNILSGSQTSEQNQGILNSGRRGTTVSQINASGVKSQRRGSNISQVSGSTATSSRTTSRGSKRFRIPTGIKFPGKSTSHSDISTNSNANSPRVKTRGGSNSHASQSNSHNKVANGISPSSKTNLPRPPSIPGATLVGFTRRPVIKQQDGALKTSTNLPRPPSIPGATLVGFTRRPVVKQGGISSQSEKVVRNQETIHKVSHNVSPSSKDGPGTLKTSTNLPRPPSIPGATLVGFTRRPAVKQGGISSQSESKVAHNQGTIRKQSSSTSTKERITPQLTNSRLSGKLPQQPSIPGATLIGVTRRPVIKQGGTSSQSEKVVHSQRTVHKVSHNVSPSRRHGSEGTLKTNSNLPLPPNIPGATLVGFTRRPVIKQGGISSQSESKVAHNQGTIRKQSSSTSTTGRITPQLTNSRLEGKLPRQPSIPGATLIGVTRRPVESKSSIKQSGLDIPGAKLVSVRKRPINITNVSQTSDINVNNSFRTVNAESIIGRPAVSLNGADTAPSKINQNNPFTISTGNQNGNSRGQGSFNFNNIISSGIQSTIASILENHSSNILSGSHKSEQKQGTLSSGRKGNTVSQINASGAQSQRRGSNPSQVSGSTTTNSRTTENANAQVNENTQTLLNSVVNNSINQGSGFRTGSSQDKDSSRQDSSVSSGTIRQVQNEHESFTTNKAQSFVNNSNQNTNLRSTTITKTAGTVQTPSRRRGSSRGRGNSQTLSNVNLSSSQVTSQSNAQRTTNNKPTVVATQINSVVSQSGSTLTNTPRRTINRNRGSRKFTPTPFLLKSNFAASSVTNVNNVANSNIDNRQQSSHSSRTQSNSRNVDSRKNTASSHNSQSNSQATQNIQNQDHQTISKSNPTLVTPLSFTSTNRGQSQSNLRSVNNNQRSSIVNQGKIAEFSDFEIELTTSPIDDTITTITEAPLLRSTKSRKRTRGRAISTISRRVASNSLSSGNNVRNAPILTQVTTTPSSNIQRTPSLLKNTSPLSSRRTTQSRTSLRPTKPSIFTSSIGTESSRTSSDKSSNSRLRSQIKTQNSNIQGSTSSKSSGNISINRSASAAAFTAPKLPRGHNFKLPANFNLPGATLIAYKTTPVKKAKESSKTSTSTSSIVTGSSRTSSDRSSNSRLRSQIKTTNSNIQGSTSSKSSGNISINRSASAAAFTAPKLPKGHNFKLPTNLNFPGATLIAYKTTPVKKTKESVKVSTSTPSNVFKTITNVESSIGKTAVPISNTNNNDRTIIRKKIRINGRPGSRNNDSKEIISSVHKPSFESTHSASLYGAKPTAIPDNTQSSIGITYGGNSNSGSSKRVLSVRRKTYGSDNSAGNNSDDNNSGDNNSRILTTARRNSYGSDSSNPTKSVTSTRRRTYGSDTSSESSTSTENNSRILSSARRNSYGSDTSADSSKHSQQASLTSSSSFGTQTYGSERTSSSFSQNTYGSDTSSESSFSSQKTLGNLKSESSSFNQGSSSQRNQQSESTSQSKSSGNNQFRNVQPKIAIVTERFPTTPASSNQGSRRRVTSRRRIVNNSKAETKVTDQNSVNSKIASTTTTRGNTNTSRRKVLKKVTKLSKAEEDNDQSVPQISENFTPPPPISATTASSSADIVSSSALSIPGLPPGLKLRVVGTSIKSSTSTRTSSSSSSHNASSNIKFGNASIGSKETKQTKNSLTDLEIEALSALAKVNSAFSHPVRGRSLRRTRQRQNSKVSSIS